MVERFELYAGGLELANAFGELTDPIEQRAPLRGGGRGSRAARGKAVYPIDEALLAALPRMPPTAGIALGFDRAGHARARTGNMPTWTFVRNGAV